MFIYVYSRAGGPFKADFRLERPARFWIAGVGLRTCIYNR